MLISIIVPVYNVEQYVENCLNSVINQTYSGGIECIVVNDATPDKSFLLAQNFVNNYKGRVFFRLIEHQRNLGLSAARNTGLLNAIGEYVLFLDSDDELERNAIDDLTKPLSVRPYDFIIGSYTTISDVNKQVKFKGDDNLLTNNQIIQALIANQWYVMAWNKLCNRKFLIEHNLFFVDGLIHEDELWSFQLANKANSMSIVSACTYKYNVRLNSIMGSVAANLSLKFNRKIILYTKIESYILDKGNISITDYQYAEQKLINILNDLYVHRKCIPIKELYKELHQQYKFPLYINSIGKIANLKHIFRDFHLYIPSNVGFLCWMFYRTIHQ